MDLSRPYSAISPTIEGDVLAVLAGLDSPISGRAVAAKVKRGTQPAVNAALERLAAQGVVLRVAAPPAFLYSLNRDHVGAEAVLELWRMRSKLLYRIGNQIAGWSTPVVHASVFGSAARGDGDAASDIDVLLIHSEQLDPEDQVWRSQCDVLAADILKWTGNPASLVELPRPREAAWPAFLRSALGKEIERDSIAVAGLRFDELRVSR